MATKHIYVPKDSTTKGENLQKKLLHQPWFIGAALALLIIIIGAYSNHFENPFEFDDAHTIVNNTEIRSIDSIPGFFSDARKFSTLPANQAYRPGLAALNAIDYAIQNKMNQWVKKDSLGKAARFQKTFCPKWMAKVQAGTNDFINPFWFHFSIFLSFLFLGFLFFHFLRYIFRKAFPDINYAHWAALIGTGLFMLHTANAETINYIISRDDSFSTMMVLMAFMIYFLWETSRKYCLFLIPVFLGYFVKEPTVMFAPLLLVYVWIFGDVDKNKTRLYYQIGASFLLALILFMLSHEMTPPNHTYGGGNWFYYILTQIFVVVHYFNSFIFPTNLSADTDWTLVNSIFDDRVLAGTLFLSALVFIVVKCWKRQETKPISFGILWFFIALAPTSIFPLSEVLNDHRPFFAYIGLTLAFTTAGILLFRKITSLENPFLPKFAMLLFMGIVLIGHAFGVHERNKVWSSGETLWKDVTEKSPGNGRGWMNYGLAFMQRSSMDSAIMYFNKALSIYPNYDYANINMAIAQEKIGNDKVAEQYYLNALKDGVNNPECYYYYGKYLIVKNRNNEALGILNQGLQISPAHEGIKILLNSLSASAANSKSILDAAREAAQKNPTPENYLNLSLQLYNAGLFLESARAAQEAVKLNPRYLLGYNNICAAFNKIGEFDSAEVAGADAVELDPQNQLAVNNYNTAQQAKAKFDKLEADAKKQPTYNNWITLSLEWYNVGNYKKSMIAAEEATLINPNDATGWNNVCAAANKIGDWDTAIIAGEKAVKIKPDFDMAKNNLAVAKQGKLSGK